MNRRDLLRLFAAGMLLPPAARALAANAGADAGKLLSVDALATGKKLKTLPKLENRAKRPGLFRATLTARARKIELLHGKPTAFLTYNGHYPGPQIVATEGDTVEIDFRNQLDQPTSIHWHGLPVPPLQDGNPSEAVEPGARRLYRFTLPEGCAGTYWYHTQAHGLLAMQMYKGLLGSFIVRAKDDPLADLPEQHWFFSDVRLRKNGAIAENTARDWMDGREGQFVLINGQYRPRIRVTGAQRIRIWNACNARILNLSLPGCRFMVVGTDGGLLPTPAAPVERLLIAPGERYEVMMQTDSPLNATLLNLPFDRHKLLDAPAADPQPLAQVDVRPGKPIELPPVLRTIEEPGTGLRQELAFTAMLDARAARDEDDRASGQPDDFPELLAMFRINGKSYDMRRADLRAPVDKPLDWTLHNKSRTDIVFHLHGAQFIVAQRTLGNHTERPPLAWKDTLHLQAHEIARIRFVPREKGIRLFQCQILEHAALGMMGQLEVE